ncbi:hypothetical protein TWF225_009503 [Orbilia oligospora]|uniref:Uncharacterized protein n=1 Tax=Orbilia oligospora TaxID=2813651 RepID=A0A8H2DTD8_ORBOL|nr:hypothetical protein TWF225_009503 [Orbilia oligospora]KAF3247757.1 hypothetical protein TWF217_009555 [Orbilia oligospora]KAF3258780.1 hypothetical protein TWF128_004576 [Orbilia oligospora]TGJ66505.1 hypothetical protein EYR41_008132 [Orbilia oligospora]
MELYEPESFLVLGFEIVVLESEKRDRRGRKEWSEMMSLFLPESQASDLSARGFFSGWLVRSFPRMYYFD